eukprot:TRINITY_DN2303_c0_g1_i2.p1 TRINITY_DN2303_c0_g1~~TRINITY_DN2303_c0_g1_i2.p1  ORF type:complete len:208 (+),score=46.57 TRINITY_DN2303_c0_g1_i2:50-673(+)
MLSKGFFSFKTKRVGGQEGGLRVRVMYSPFVKKVSPFTYWRLYSQKHQNHQQHQDQQTEPQQNQQHSQEHQDPSKVSVGTIDPALRRLALIFTCTVCNTRNSRTFSYLSYTEGVVIAECAGCKNRHLIADNLGWFKDTPTNVETLAQENGVPFKKLDDITEFFKDSVFEMMPPKKKQRIIDGLKPGLRNPPPDPEDLPPKPIQNAEE